MFVPKKSFLSVCFSKESVILVTASILLICNYYFPIFLYDFFLYFISTFFYLLILPVLVLLFLKEDLHKYGFTWKRWPFGIKATALIILVPVSYTFLAVSLPHINTYYTDIKAESVIGSNITYIAMSLGLYFFAWEFFFRGFLLFGLQEKFGEFSIVIQAALFAVAHIGKPALEVLISPFAGLFFGIIAYRSRSFLPVVLIHLGMNLFYS